MLENRSFQFAVLVSLLLHFTIFLSAPYTAILPGKDPVKSIKVAYFKTEKSPKKLMKQRSKSYTLPPVAPEALPEVRGDDIVNPMPVPQPQIVAKSEGIKKEEPIVETIVSGSGGRAVIGGKDKKFEAVVNDEKDSVKKATYISYYRLVREKIRYYANRNYIKEGSVNQGEVFLSFVVTSRGELIHIMIIDKKSADDALLRDIAINSIRDASPFSAFPQGMNQYQITFNVVISFELNK